jgi:hypothetical protein
MLKKRKELHVYLYVIVVFQSHGYLATTPFTLFFDPGVTTILPELSPPRAESREEQSMTSQNHNQILPEQMPVSFPNEDTLPRSSFSTVCHPFPRRLSSKAILFGCVWFEGGTIKDLPSNDRGFLLA